MIQKIIFLKFLFFIIFIGNAQKKEAKSYIKTVEEEDIIKHTIESPNVKSVVLWDTISNWKLYKENARVSYYASKFNGKRTASGLKFDNTKLTAAHKKLPFGTLLRVTNFNSGKSVLVEVIDRGPYVKSREIDLSKSAFMQIADKKDGDLMTVRIEIKDYFKYKTDK